MTWYVCFVEQTSNLLNKLYSVHWADKKADWSSRSVEVEVAIENEVEILIDRFYMGHIQKRKNE